jgi:threonine synthase
MSFLSKLRCVSCSKILEADTFTTKCRFCGGLLHIEYDLERAKESINRSALDRGNQVSGSIKRYYQS